MEPLPVAAIFDIGKTNKKLFLFDENYNLVFEETGRFEETTDEDGFPCEDINKLQDFVCKSLSKVLKLKEFLVKAVNFSTYGASFVYLDERGKPLTPLYNYLKPFPEDLKRQFYDTYGGEEKIASETASPVLGNLNSGMQIYRVKYEKPELFKKIKLALHLPQYLSFLISGNPCSDITSIGCHTNLWDFNKNDYHEWVYKEGIKEKLAPVKSLDHTDLVVLETSKLKSGIGVHDSSAALIPYLISFTDPFVLISTGTWCITINPFNHSPLTPEELSLDCLSYMNYKGEPVKASRLFSGNEHEQQVKRIAQYFGLEQFWFRNICFNPELLEALVKKDTLGVAGFTEKDLLKDWIFAKRELVHFNSPAEAYHQLILDLVRQQKASTDLVLKGTKVKRIFVDGGFSKNSIYMNLLAWFYPEMEVYAASMAQATSVGTALAIHHEWNRKKVPDNIIDLRLFSPSGEFLIKHP